MPKMIGRPLKILLDLIQRCRVRYFSNFPDQNECNYKSVISNEIRLSKMNFDAKEFFQKFCSRKCKKINWMIIKNSYAAKSDIEFPKKAILQPLGLKSLIRQRASESLGSLECFRQE